MTMHIIVLIKLVFVLSLYHVIEPLVDARDPHLSRKLLNAAGPVEHLVKNLPGQPAVVNFRHYAGYITVNKKMGRALFYWFYEATSHADDKPLVLWLNGGPGCSSVGYGATQEIGPFQMRANGRSLNSNAFSWNTEANLLFMESPIGVGFSYTNTSGDYDNLGDEFTAKDAYAFLQKWFLMFPSYRTRMFFIAGESYAGKYVPELAEVIIDNNKNSSFINLKGILLGNPETDDAEDWRGYVDYAWSHAIVTDETHKTIIESCDFHSADPLNNTNCSNAMDEVYRQYNEIDVYSLYTPTCIRSSDNKSSPITAPTSPGFMAYDPCLDDYVESYYNRLDVQKALHVSDGTTLRNWSICNSTLFDSWYDSKPSMIPIYQKLIDADLRICGDTDGRVPVLSTRYSLSLIKLPITTAWRPWYYKKQVAGWIEEYNGITFVTVKGAGHAVPTFKPEESLALFASFLAGKTLPSAR
ncbi:Serine carboxypeptidase-like 31 [Orobanche gracilis]